MRDLVLKKISPDLSREENINVMRQGLQILILKTLHESSAGASIAFTGGTALRMLHDLPRFSEDLDFSLVKPEAYDFNRLVSHVRQSLKKLALPADYKVKSDKTVHHLFIRFRELLFEAGLSPQKKEKLPIRIEIDTIPPQGWKTEISLLSDFYTFPVVHFDLPSAFATKLHACLYRRYTKGRDYYDLMWYIGKRIRPNLRVLNNAIAQTEETPSPLTGENLKKLLLHKIESFDFKKLRNDVTPFLLHTSEINLLDRDLMLQVVQKYEF